LSIPRPQPAPTMAEHQRRRINSRELPTTPASHYETPLAQQLWRWINRKEREEDTYYQGLPRHARKIGVGEEKFRRWASGETRQPPREDCHRLALYFGIDEEEVLRLAGYETYTSLIQAAQMVMPDRPDLLETLMYTLTPAWQTSQTQQKKNADRLLAGADPIERRTVLIVDNVRAWFAKMAVAEQKQVRAQLARVNTLEATG
jgi:hypothetical protein